MSDKAALKDHILAERDSGNVVFMGLPGETMVAKLDDFVEQPADGILYDLNRLEEVSLTFLDDPKWVNDFAVALTIRKLVQQRDEARLREPIEPLPERTPGERAEDAASREPREVTERNR